MTIRTGRWLLLLLCLVLFAWALSFAAAAVLAEGAVHPLLKRRASDTAALAYSVANASGATARKVSVTAADGVKLNGWWLSPAHPNSRGVMVCHGVADSAYGALGYALLFLTHGYSVLLPESRGHGESGGFVTYGVLEAGASVQWLGWMKSNGVKAVFGFGESLGGAILIQSLAKGAGFQAVVAECPYSSFEAVADERVARVIPAPLAVVLVKEGIFYIRRRYRVDLADASTAAAIARVHAPVLLIHGQADGETSPRNSIQLARLNRVRTVLWLVPGARHTGAYAQDPNGFEQRVLGWFADRPDDGTEKRPAK